MNKDYLPYFLVSSPAFLWRFESVETDTSSRPIYRIHPGRGVAGGGTPYMKVVGIVVGNFELNS